MFLTTILIVDNHVIVQEGLRRFAGTQFPQAVIEEVWDAEWFEVSVPPHQESGRSRGTGY